MAQGREDIPAETQRAVRQKSGFGCVDCGNPIITYEHIVPWAEVKKHEVENLTLLCWNRQHESKVGLLTRAQVHAAVADPMNIKMGVTAPYRFNFAASDQFQLTIGGNRFISLSGERLLPLIVDDIPLIGMYRTPEGELMLHLTMRDEQDLLSLLIRDNVMQTRIETWDIKFIGQTLTINEAARKFFLRMTFKPPDEVVIDRARILFHGVEVLVSSKGLIVDGVIRADSNWFHTDIGFVVGIPGVYQPNQCILLLLPNRYRRTLLEPSIDTVEAVTGA